MPLDFLSPDDIVADPEDDPGFRYRALRKKDRHSSTKDRHKNRLSSTRPFTPLTGKAEESTN
jgi:hypothetical protein